MLGNKINQRLEKDLKVIIRQYLYVYFKIISRKDSKYRFVKYDQNFRCLIRIWIYST